ncbi:MAG: hypothetical protein ABJB76_08535 [Candidatus Nitrosocosmicus sp.]
MIIYSIYKKNHPVTPKEVVVNVFDLGYIGVKIDFPEQMSSYRTKRKETKTSYLQKKKQSITKSILKSG